MSNRISQLKSALGIGARANRFRVYITFPNAVNVSGTGLSEKCDVLCVKCDGFPAIEADASSINIQGRTAYIPKQKENGGDWKATFYNSESYDLKRAFIEWVKAVDHPIANTTTGDPFSVSVTLRVAQLDSAENETIVGNFYNAFCIGVGAQDFDGSSAGDVEQFEVTWKYDYFLFGDDSENMRTDQYNTPTQNPTSLNN